MKYRPALTENSTLVDTQFLSTHSAKLHSAERRVQFPSFVGSVLPLGNPQCLVFFLIRKADAALPYCVFTSVCS